jgi:predicted amidohydrolase YtcJ
MRKALYLMAWACLFFTCSSPKDTPTVIFVNGKIWTGEGPDTFVEALAISGNIVSAIGDSKTISALATGDTEVIDLQGKLVTAGFNDAHIHFLSGSMGLTQVDLLATKSLEEVLSITLASSKTTPKNPG